MYVVADGLGGHEYGERASRLAVDTLLTHYYDAPHITPEKRIRDLIQQVNQGLIAFSKKNLTAGEKTDTTVVVAVIRDDKLLVANVGDSPAYLIRGGKIRKITHDHSMVGELVRAGRITEAEARESRYRNRLSRSVGGENQVEVEFYPQIPLQVGDAILLCTDGLTQYASEQTLLGLASHGTPREIVERLIAFARDQGGSDNITAAIVQVKHVKRSFPTSAWLLAISSLILVSAMAGWLFFSDRLWAGLVPTPTPTITQTAIPSLTPSPLPTSTIALPPSPTPIDPAPVPGPELETQACIYVAKEGETVELIREKFLVAPDQVLLLGPAPLKPGQSVLIRGISQTVCEETGGSVPPPPPTLTPSGGIP